MEVLVESLDYSIEKVENGKYVLRPPNSEIERSARYEFIQTQFQQAIAFHEHNDEERLRLKDAVERLAEPMKARFCKYVKEPVERFTTEFFVEGPVMKLLNDEGLFKEEYMLLRQACRELMTPLDDLLEFELAAGLTVWDVLKAQRLINNVRWHMANFLLPELSKRPGVVVQSLVPHFTDRTFEALLGESLGKEKVGALIELLVWKPEDSRVFDVQYQPIIREANGYLVPLNLFGGSDLLRNLLQLTRRRLYEDGRNDPLPTGLKQAFLARTACAEVGIVYHGVGEDGEIDVLVLWDGMLFAFECKNSLLPVGPYELRTSYDYIRTANDQLDRFRNAFGSMSFRAALARQLARQTGEAWPIGHDTKLVTCIVMANRMFMGYRLGQNSVRGSYELAGFVQNGTYVMGEEVRCFWSGPSPCGEDLRMFIKEDTTYQLIWGAMEEYEQEYSFGKCRVSRPTFQLWPRRLAELLRFSKTAAEIEEMEKQVYEEKLKGQAELQLLAAERMLLRRDSH